MIDDQKDVKMINKLLKTLIFKKYDSRFYVDPRYYEREKPEAGVGEYDFEVFLDMDRYAPVSPDFDMEYNDFVKNLDRRIHSVLKYVNLSHKYGYLQLNWINDEKTKKSIENLNDEFYDYMESKYEIDRKTLKPLAFYRFQVFANMPELDFVIKELPDEVNRKINQNTLSIVMSKILRDKYPNVSKYITLSSVIYR